MFFSVFAAAVEGTGYKEKKARPDRPGRASFPKEKDENEKNLLALASIDYQGYITEIYKDLLQKNKIKHFFAMKKGRRPDTTRSSSQIHGKEKMKKLALASMIITESYYKFSRPVVTKV